MRIALRPVDRPVLDSPIERPDVPAEEFEARCRSAYAASGTEWLIVYADRERPGNIAFLVGYDPRFEESLLILGPDDTRTLLVGNEGTIYAQIVGMPLDIVLCQTFSLMGQPRDRAPRLEQVFRDMGLAMGDSAALVGWKYLEPVEDDDYGPAFVPALVVECLRRVIGSRPIDGTSLFLHPEHGLRATVTADQIAQWEWAAVRASRSVFGVIDRAAPGISELAAVAGMAYEGDPLSAHVMFASGSSGLNGLRSPTRKIIDPGDAVTTAIGYWGGLTCRAGVIDGNDEEFMERLVVPYFRAIATWYSTIGLGIRAEQVWHAVMDYLNEASFRPLVNPGHLTGHEEWTHSPFRQDSDDVLQSGMALQSDIIPFPVPNGWAINAEDTLVLADAELRNDIANRFPAMAQRFESRRQYINGVLGMELGPEVLPLVAQLWLFAAIMVGTLGCLCSGLSCVKPDTSSVGRVNEHE
ncbi:MAG: M24 family metallopeptidase [Thermomicrobiales bacterium]